MYVGIYRKREIANMKNVYYKQLDLSEEYYKVFILSASLLV